MCVCVLGGGLEWGGVEVKAVARIDVFNQWNKQLINRGNVKDKMKILIRFNKQIERKHL